MLHEISRKIINVNKYDGTSILWNNSVLTVRGNKELHLLEYSFNLNCLEKRIDFIESSVSSSNNCPLPKDYLTKYAAHGVKNLELVEMVINSAFWPHNKLLMQEMTSITAFEWAPFSSVNENYDLLATLNSIGNIDFYGRVKHAWCSVMDFSSEMKANLSDQLNKLTKYPTNFSEIKTAVYNLETASMCWAPELDVDNSCCFVTAQKSREIYFWSIKYHDNIVQTQFLNSIQSSIDVETVLVLWIPMASKRFLLVCSYDNGQVIAHECQIRGQKITLKEVHNIWSFKDKMVTTYLHYHCDEDKLLLLFNKHRHLVVQMYDKNLKLLSQHVRNVNDYKITSLTKYKNMFYLTTINTKIYRISYSIANEEVKISLASIEIKDTYPSYELFGLAISTNGALFALALINRKLLHKKQSLKIEIALFSPNVGCDAEVMSIINNPSKTLTNMWDIIETLRCKTLKTKKLPEADYSILLRDDSDIYHRKVYLIILNLYSNLEKTMTPFLKQLLPVTSVNVLKDRIFMLQAFNTVHTIYEKFQNDINLDSLDVEAFDGCKKYLYHYCKKYGRNVKDIVSNDILNTTHVKFKYQCQSCDENIIDFTCTNGHNNMICSLTFTPIEDDYLVCKSCGAIARNKLLTQNSTCVLCDIYLRKC